MARTVTLRFDPVVVFVAFAVICLSALAIGYVYIDHKTFADQRSQTLASWVQAIGSILAIMGSAVIVIWQVGKQHRLQRDMETINRIRAELDRVGPTLRVARYAAWEVVRFIRACTDEQNLVLYFVLFEKTQDLDLVEQALRGIDVNAFQSASLQLATLRLRKEFSAMRTDILGVRDSSRRFKGTVLVSGRQPVSVDERRYFRARLIPMTIDVKTFQEREDELKKRLRELGAEN